MNAQKFMIVLVGFLLLVSATAGVAGDFDWEQKLNVRAQNDLSGFKASLAARFQIGDAEIRAVFNDVENPADAYVVFRLGEMSAKSTDYVMEKYRSEKGKGWGALAKSLGIKPGSKEFHALRRGPDIEYVSGQSQTGKKSKNKGKG
ncbi:MAG: hypothetical protein RQ754_01110 [Desulfuromonadales bacterium]|nr:hypothetical protein [Desulfuromonadales bacterium]